MTTEEDVKDMAGKTILSVDLTYGHGSQGDSYHLYLRFTDGARIILPVEIPEDDIYSSADDMLKATGYFTKSETDEKIREDKESRRISAEDVLQRQIHRYKKLKAEFRDMGILVEKDD